MYVKFIHCHSSLYFLITVVGFCTNSLIISAKVTSKSLHGTCNLLIAFCAFADILHLLGHVPKMASVFSGHLYMSSYSCCLLQIVPNFGVSAGTFLVLSIAVDRLIAVRSATFAVTLNNRTYLSMHAIAILAFAALQYAIIVRSYEDTVVVCTPPEAYQTNGKELWAATSLAVYALAISVYYAVWKTLKKHAKMKARRVSRTIFVILVVVICGWLLTMCLIIVKDAILQLKGHAKFLGNELAGIPVNSSLSMNYFVLYFTSVEYRAVFRRNLQSLPVLGSLFYNNAITVIAVDIDHTTNTFANKKSVLRDE